MTFFLWHLFDLWIFYVVYLWYVNELQHISSSGAPDLRLQSLADVPQLDALDETWVEALHSSSLLIGTTNDAFDKHWYVHDMFISLFPLFWFSSCYSFPVLLLFFPRLVLNTCLFFPTVFLTADKTTDPASCFIFGGCATALPYCGSQTGPDFAVALFWQEDLRRSGITRCHVSLSAMSQVLSTVEVTEPWAWHLFFEKKGMLLGILF